MAVSRYCKGERTPSSELVERLAAMLKFPPEFFYGNPLAEPTHNGPTFRALSKMTARQRNQAVASGTLGVHLSGWIKRKFNLPKPSIPTYEEFDTPEVVATDLRMHWGIGERPIRHMVDLLEYYGVRVFALADDIQSVDAFSFWCEGKPYIFLNTTMSAERSRMDAAHELGHLILHSSEVTQRRPQLEREAQEFAASFLMPRRSVLALVKAGSTLPEIIKAKHNWNVSVANLTYRLHKLGLLTKYQYTSAFIEIGRRKYRTREPEPSARETSQVLNKVFGILRKRGTTIVQIADELALPRDEVSKFLFRLVNFPISVGFGNRQTPARSEARATDLPRIGLVKASPSHQSQETDLPNMSDPSVGTT